MNIWSTRGKKVCDTSEDLEKTESHSKDSDNTNRSRRSRRTWSYGQHQFRMNRVTFYNFYTGIWEKYQGRTRERIDELTSKLEDLGYEKIKIEESWINNTPTLPKGFDITDNICQHVQLTLSPFSSPSPLPPSPKKSALPNLNNDNDFTSPITRSKTKN